MGALRRHISQFLHAPLHLRPALGNFRRNSFHVSPHMDLFHLRSNPKAHAVIAWILSSRSFHLVCRKHRHIHISLALSASNQTRLVARWHRKTGLVVFVDDHKLRAGHRRARTKKCYSAAALAIASSRAAAKSSCVVKLVSSVFICVCTRLRLSRRPCTCSSSASIL